ncbi:MAG: DNA strand exchange inhibitor protein [Phycisphaerae bacterium]|nr:DNA strand exchange inhibitor protein [Phycisphaerae bacterium]
MDEHTLEKLEFDRVRQLLAKEAQCALGRDLAHRVQPSRRRAQITVWLQQARQFSEWIAAHGLPPFGGIRDVRDQVRRAVPPAKLEPEEFAELASTLEGIGLLRKYLHEPGEPGRQGDPGEESHPEGGEHFDLIAKLGERLGDFQVIADRINQAIDPRGAVRDQASDRLMRLRQEIEEIRRQTRAVFDRLLKQQAIVRLLQYPNATFHADRMVMPLKADQRGRLPGIVHRSSDSGQTVFVEPAEAVELNNTRLNLLQLEQEEINRILWELTHQVHLNQQGILRTLEAVALVDLLTAKHKLAKRHDMHIPEIIAGDNLKLTRARNPILMAMSEEEAEAGRPVREVVPIDVRLGDDFDIMMITGPNTGGKTATLKTVGLLALMAQSGLPIPAAAGSSLPVFEDVWIDVGDEQSLEQSLSTFSAHLARILDIIHRARKHTLVLFDELGAGTDPDEGAAIGRAIVDRLLASGSLAMVTTHLGALKALGYEIERVDNAAVQFDVETLQPTFKLRLGEPGNSNAIAIASRLGMPRKMVVSAKKHLAGGYRALNRAIAGTLRTRREAELARRDAEKARLDAARETLAALDRAKALEEQQKLYARWVDCVLKLQPGDRVYVRKFDKSGRIVRVRLERQQAAVDLGNMEVEVPLAELVFVKP